jgi:signal transduction histidine kinase
MKIHDRKDGWMVDQPALSIFAHYERLRQQRILSVLLPASIFLIGMGCLFYSFALVRYPQSRVGAVVNYPLVLVLFLGFIAGFVALRREAVAVASLLTVITGCIVNILTLISRSFLVGTDGITFIEFLLLGAAIVLIGLFINTFWLIVSTILINCVTALCLIVAGLQNPSTDALRNIAVLHVTVLILAILFEWVIAAFVIVQRVAYEQVLRDLGGAFEQLQQLDDLKDQFITHVNHELRNPIQTLCGTIEFAILAREQLTSNEQEELLHKALRSGNGLAKLVKSILDVSDIKSGETIKTKPVSLYRVLDDALQLINPQTDKFTQRELHISIPENLCVLAEPTHLQQIFVNLLSNALKYTPDGSPIDIEANLGEFISEKRGHRLTQMVVDVVIRDYGPGIPPDQIPMLFHRFVRLPGDFGSNIPGNGLGLYLCRVFAEAMNGRIWIESRGIPGDGTTVHLQLESPLR